MSGDLGEDEVMTTSSDQQMQLGLVMKDAPYRPGVAVVLAGHERCEAMDTIKTRHYTRSVSSAKSHYVRFEDALVVWSIPANKNIAKFLFGWNANVWELSRLWAPDGHELNLLTRAISAGVKIIKRLENPDALVSYADPNVGHHGGVYRAASWIYHGRSDEVRSWKSSDGCTIARRAFHSAGKSLVKSEIEALGYTEIRSSGKERFVRPLTRKAKRFLYLRMGAS